ncbi:MAG: hypothetical protein WEB06_04915 [Actinomycetota bacterium]
MNARRRALRMLPAIAVFLLVPACLPGLFALDAGDRLSQTAEPTGRPEIDLWINAAGNDAIDVFLDGRSSDRRRIAEAVAAWLGFPGVIAHEHDNYPDTSTVQIDGRLIEPGAADDWVLDLDAAGLARVLVTTGYEAGTLVICTPVVETRIRASEPSDLDALETVCELSGRGWTIRTFDAGQPRIRITLLPDPAYYLAYAAGVLLGTVLLGAFAWWLATKLRNGPFRRRSAASVAIGLIAGGIATIGLAAAAAGAGALAGPADNLALARDLAVGGYASSLLFPALVASAPGILFAMMLVRRRPSDDAEGAIGPGIAPPSPPDGPSPPPLPWNAG